jgi:hypothetical protein
MPMKCRTKCAVPACGAPISGYSNLCKVHMVPGAIVRLGSSTMIITSWLAQHGQEQGLIALNDFALGDRFRGAVGFLAKLREQGFTNVQNLATPEELEAARSKKHASWSGPWRARYPWQEGSQEKKRVFSDLGALVLTNVFGPGADGANLMALVYKDGTIRLKYSDGDAANISLQDRVEEVLTLDELIESAEKFIRMHCSTVTPETPQLTVHRVPAGLDDEGTRKWLESLPGVELVEHSERPE